MNPLYAVIGGCEILFWVFLVAGLAVRYLLGRPRAGAALLLCVPLADLVLLGATALDLRGGGEAETVHALAAVYLGLSVAWGHQLVGWADVRFAHRLAGGLAPVAPPKGGREQARRARRAWARHVLAWAVGCLLLLGAVALVGDGARTTALQQVVSAWTLVLVVDGVWSLSYTVWPRPLKRAPRGASGSGAETAPHRPSAS